jgi:hypothetical protein
MSHCTELYHEALLLVVLRVAEGGVLKEQCSISFGPGMSFASTHATYGRV